MAYSCHFFFLFAVSFLFDASFRFCAEGASAFGGDVFFFSPVANAVKGRHWGGGGREEGEGGKEWQRDLDFPIVLMYLNQG